MRRRALEKAARRWWRLPEGRWGNAEHYAYSRVDQLPQRPSLVGALFSALVRTVPAGDPEALRFLGAAWFEDVLTHYPEGGEALLLTAHVSPDAWAPILEGTYPSYRKQVPRLASVAGLSCAAVSVERMQTGGLSRAAV